MAEIINMPRLSDTMEEGTVVKWHKNVGDTLSEGDIIAEIETDKAIQDFESEFDGVLLHQGSAEGEAAPVDSILAIIGSKGEDISTLLGGNTAPQPAAETKEEASEPVVENPTTAEIPEGVNVITMPRLSDTMEEGTVVKWHKAVGDNVKEGDIIAEIETDKAVQDFESEFDGILLYVGMGEGESAPVDSILSIIGPKGTDVSGVVANFGKAKAPAPAESTPTVSPEKKEDPLPTETMAASPGGRIFASPLAKKLAAEKGVPLTEVKGTGDNGRIIKRDVENHQPSAAPVASKSAAPSPAMSFTAGEDQKVPVNNVRKVIAKRLAESKFTAPHYYLNIEVDMENAIAARNSMNSLPDTKISFNDIVVKATAMALRKHPQVNSSWKEDHMLFHGDIHIGVAVAIADGLVVPVVKHADQKPLSAINAEVKDKAVRARDRQLKADEMEGSTFTISNLGMFGIESFTSIINQPNSCILSVGAIVEKPVVKHGGITVGNTMKLSLACDHRTVDGATGAQFLQDLKLYLENPTAMLV